MSTLIIITGASKGIGRSIATAFAKDTRIDKLRLCLIARNLDGLKQTQQIVNSLSSSQRKIQSSIHSIDLSKIDTLHTSIEKLFKEEIQQDKFERTMLINNAGSLGYVGPSSDMPTPMEMTKVVNFNVTSAIWISSYFVKFFAYQHKTKCNVVNISSLCAITPFKTMAMYCSGKAARDMWHKTLAAEETSIRVLNYAPGAIETDMTDILANAKELDPELSAFYKRSKVQHTYIQPATTAKKLVNLIMEDKYASGDHVDFWDE